MILGITIASIVLFIVFGCIALYALENLSDEVMTLSGSICLISLTVLIIVIAYGSFNGFINYPKTEGTHQGVVTAVDLEGVYFRRYEVYLKSSGYTTQSDETVYKIYDYETDLANQLKDCIGKEVKLNYGHDGGYIGWNSCGTYHIKSVEVIERKQVEENDR